jgi:hypothetical protein
MHIVLTGHLSTLTPPQSHHSSLSPQPPLHIWDIFECALPTGVPVDLPFAPPQYRATKGSEIEGFRGDTRSLRIHRCHPVDFIYDKDSGIVKFGLIGV